MNRGGRKLLEAFLNEGKTDIEIELDKFIRLASSHEYCWDHAFVPDERRFEAKREYEEARKQLIMKLSITQHIKVEHYETALKIVDLKLDNKFWMNDIITVLKESYGGE